jgi:hypothetical protein
MSEAVQGSVEGRSFTRCSQCLACLMMLGVLWQGWLALNQPGSEPLDRTTSVLLGLGLLSLLACLAFILTSRTRIDDTHISQTGIWSRKVPIAKISQLKMIHVPRLAWLIAPRLVVRTGLTGWYVFHAAEDPVIQRFWALSLKPYTVPPPN